LVLEGGGKSIHGERLNILILVKEFTWC